MLGGGKGERVCVGTSARKFLAAFFALRMMPPPTWIHAPELSRSMEGTLLGDFSGALWGSLHLSYISDS